MLKVFEVDFVTRVRQRRTRGDQVLTGTAHAPNASHEHAADLHLLLLLRLVLISVITCICIICILLLNSLVMMSTVVTSIFEVLWLPVHLCSLIRTSPIIRVVLRVATGARKVGLKTLLRALASSFLLRFLRLLVLSGRLPRS